MTTVTTDRVKPVDTLAFTALAQPREAMDWVRSLLAETRPANVMEIGRILQGYDQNETVAMMVAVARAHYLTLTAEPEPVAQPQAPVAQGPEIQVGYATQVCRGCGSRATSDHIAQVGTIIEVNACGICKAKASKPAPAPKAPAAQGHEVTGSGWNGEIADGTYTVIFEGGEYRTLKVRTQDDDAGFKPGARLISYLNGPDNWRNYEGFGEIEPGNRLKVWRKHEGATTIIRAALALLAGKEAMVDGLKAYGKQSGSCGLCGKKLTTPESLELGIGPICASKLGI